MLTREQMINKIQIENFKSIEGMKLTMGYKEEDGFAYLTGTNEKEQTFELAKIKL